MNKLNVALFFTLALAPAVSAFQSEGILPWVTNNPNFRSTVIVNNLNDVDVEVILVATRNNGDEEGVILEIPALSQVAADAGSLFPVLGDGPGYTVIAVYNDPNVSSAFIINSQSGASGNSPAQADVVSPDAAGENLLFNFLPVIPGSGASAPVVVNLGEEEAQIVFHAYQGGTEIATSEPIALASGRPFADITANLFPGVEGNIFVVAESTQPLVGMAFIFNEFGEPSMANATAIAAVPGVQ